MVLKILGQLLVLGAKIVSGTIRESIKQLTANTGRNSASKTPLARTTATLSSMQLDEALKVLNVSPSISVEELQSKFERMYKANDRTAGGSFYLQSKIVRARERIEMEREVGKLQPNSPS